MPKKSHFAETLSTLDWMSVASCTCGTKTPELKFHKKDCDFSVLQTARSLVAERQENEDGFEAAREPQREAREVMIHMGVKGTTPYFAEHMANPTHLMSFDTVDGLMPSGKYFNATGEKIEIKEVK